MKMIKDVHLVKWSQALLGSTLVRDNQMQIALNNAVEGDGLSISFPSHSIVIGALHYSNFSAYAFKNPFGLVESFDFTLKTALEHHIIMLDTKIFEAALAINSPWYI
ncbi:MAG: hypothetical protein GY793_02350 [Proteobacteria bacterium]|nr:hypothetical protein [Pseudomonadota bacterium]